MPEEPSPVSRIVVVGGGVAGMTALAALRRAGYTGELVLVSEDPDTPYDRPPLSKEFLRGETDHPSLNIDPVTLGVELYLGSRAHGLRPSSVLTEHGAIPFDRLLIATGAVPVTLSGTDSAMTLRTLADARRLRHRLADGARLLVVGAGWIAAEVATNARHLGCDVTVVEAASVPFPGALPEIASREIVRWYADAGVTLHLNSPAARIGQDYVELGDGRRLDGDVVLVTVGARADLTWLAGSNIAVDRGVLVDEHLRTSLPGVYAAGDAAQWLSRRSGQRRLVQHWDVAVRSAEVAAANLLGDTQVFDPVPYFWSDQFGRRIQMVGVIGQDDRPVWRGRATDPAWALAWLRTDGAVSAMVAVDRPRDTLQARWLIESSVPVDEKLLSDPSIQLRAAATPSS